MPIRQVKSLKEALQLKYPTAPRELSNANHLTNYLITF